MGKGNQFPPGGTQEQDKKGRGILGISLPMMNIGWKRPQIQTQRYDRNVLPSW